ncbi:hypothetical protein ACOQFO_06875 [Ureibacillus sp. MALMAid1270]|uniref:hypothetical protein n=1 Tax=Ureibacillus sp. MALMAid1270 TaxID=3411629 RepID=UPI003BA50036
MNEMKRSLIEVAGDMSESKDRVRKRLLERHEKKKDFKKNLLAGVSVATMIFVLFLTTNWLMNEQLGNSVDSNEIIIGLFDDTVFETSIKLQRAVGFIEEEEYLKEYAYDDYENYLAFYTYAQSLGYEITEQEINKSFEQTMNQMKVDFNSYFEELIAKSDLTWEEIEEYQYKLAPFDVALEKLKLHYVELYPKIEWNIASSLAQKHAIPYFRENYANDIIAFKKKHSLSLHDGPIFSGVKHVGRVVAFEDNMFLVSTKATIEDIETLSKKELMYRYSTEGTWYPLNDTPEISEGDLVETYYQTQTSTNTTPIVSDLWDLKILEKYEPETVVNKNTITLTVYKDNISKVKSFLSMLEWEHANFTFSKSPDYELVVNDIMYQIWSYSDGFVLYSTRGVYRKLNADFTEEFAGYLGIDSGLK